MPSRGTGGTAHGWRRRAYTVTPSRRHPAEVSWTRPPQMGLLGMPHTTRTQVCGCGAPSRGQDGTGRVWRRRAGHITPSVRRPAGVICDSAVACGTFRQLAQGVWNWRVGSWWFNSQLTSTHTMPRARMQPVSTARLFYSAPPHTSYYTTHEPEPATNEQAAPATQGSIAIRVHGPAICPLWLSTRARGHMHHVHSMCMAHASYA